MKSMHKMFTPTRKNEHSASESCYTPAISFKPRNGARNRAVRLELDRRSAGPWSKQASKWSRSRP